jgi:hypothetical protein
VKKKKEILMTVMMQPNYACCQIFTKEHETLFPEYLLQCSNMNYSLIAVACCHLGYETAIIITLIYQIHGLKKKW